MEKFKVNIDRGLTDDQGHHACFEEIEGDPALFPWKDWLEKGWLVPAAEPATPALPLKDRKTTKTGAQAPGGEV